MTAHIKILLAAAVFSAQLAFADGGDATRGSSPLVVVRGGLAGYISPEDGKLLAEPRYSVAGIWSEGRCWVQEDAEIHSPGTFLDMQAKPISSEPMFDLAAVRFELPGPQFNGGIAVVAAPKEEFMYIGLDGKPIAPTTRVGAFMRQDSDLIVATGTNGMIGYVSREGETRITPRFRDARPFRGGRAAASETGKWGLIDESGKRTSAQEFDEIIGFADEQRFWAARIDDDWTVIDRDGKPLPLPASPSPPWLWLGDTVTMQIDGLWGVFSIDGATVIPPQYTAVDYYSGRAKLWMVQSTNGLWGVASTNSGAQIAACKFDGFRKLGRNLDIAQKDGIWGVFNATNGEFATKGRYISIVPLDDAAEDSPALARVQRGGKWGAISTTTGEETIPVQFDGFDTWFTWIAVQDGKTASLLDYAGKTVLSWEGNIDGLPDPDYVTSGLGVLKTEDGATLISTNATLPIAKKFDDAEMFADGLWNVLVDGKWGYADAKGEIAIRPQFNHARPFIGGVAAVANDGKWSMISRNGDFVGDNLVFEELGAAANGLAPAKSGGKWGLVTTTGTIALPFEYDAIQWFSGHGGDDLPGLRYYGKAPMWAAGLEFFGR